MLPNNYDTLNSEYEDRGNSYRQEEEELEGTVPLSLAEGLPLVHCLWPLPPTFCQLTFKIFVEHLSYVRHWA